MRILCFVLTQYSYLIFTFCKLSCNGGTPLHAGFASDTMFDQRVKSGKASKHNEEQLALVSARVLECGSACWCCRGEPEHHVVSSGDAGGSAADHQDVNRELNQADPSTDI